MGVNASFFCDKSCFNNNKCKEDVDFSNNNSIISTNFYTDCRTEERNVTVQSEKAVKNLVSDSLYELLSKRVSLKQYVKVKLKGFNTSLLYETLNVLIDEILSIQNKEIISSKTRLINYFLLMNIKKPVIELDCGYSNNEDFNALYEYIISVLVEVYHYNKKDVFLLMPNKESGIYSFNYWKDIKDINQYFRKKIFAATCNLIKMKVKYIIIQNSLKDYKEIEISEDLEECSSEKVFVLQRFMKSIYKCQYRII